MQQVSSTSGHPHGNSRALSLGSRLAFRGVSSLAVDPQGSPTRFRVTQGGLEVDMVSPQSSWPSPSVLVAPLLFEREPGRGQGTGPATPTFSPALIPAGSVLSCQADL